MTNNYMYECIFIGIMKAVETAGFCVMGILLVALIYHDHIHISIT